MNKFFKRIAAPVLWVLMLPLVVSAQDDQMMQPLPTDPAVRIGQLPNGLTYYIRHNEFPKGQADFYLAQNVGSALEEDNQRGLAHFLEHMCFNGTTHFPGNTMEEWIESIGVVDFNAYTGIDETVYNISSVPTSRQSVQDSCLLILRDWANDLTLDPKEIDKERAVIHEEWRRTTVGSERIVENILPDIFPTSKYGHRLPIGTMEVVDNFPYQALRDYYEAWYRPDQQAVIVVGDIDVDRIEGKIKDLFSDIEMPANAPERTFEPVPDHEGTLYGIGDDPEMPALTAEVYWLSDPMPKQLHGSLAHYVNKYMEHMISYMLRERLNDIAANPDAPFAGPSLFFVDFFTKSKYAMGSGITAKENDIITPLASLYREVLRAQRGGFTESEYERARNRYLSDFERAYNNRATATNEGYANEYVRHFLDGDAIPGIEMTYNIVNMLADQIPLEAVNATFAELVTPDNRAIMVYSPRKEGYTLPTREAIEAALAAVDAETIEGFVEDVNSEPFVPVAPVPGEIVSVRENPLFGTTEWTLSNGATVIIKPTRFKEDEIVFTAYANGGYAGKYTDDYANSVIFMPVALSRSGRGTYTNSDFRKYVAGKQISVWPSFQSYVRTVSGSTTPKDLAGCMEVLYMTFKDIQWTDEEFSAIQNSYGGMLANNENDPVSIFGRDVAKTKYASPFEHVLTAEAVSEASREKVTKIVHDLTANAADWTFTIVGNVDPEVLRPLVETYIASLPGDPATAVKKVDSFDPAYFAATGTATNVYTARMETPQTFVSIYEIAPIEYTSKNTRLATIAGQILSNRLNKTVREEMGAVYSIGASGLGTIWGNNQFVIVTEFPMKPEMKNEVLDFIAGQLKAMESDITESELANIKEMMVTDINEAIEQNDYWMNCIVSHNINGVDILNGAVDIVNSLTVDDVKDFMKAMNAAGNYRVIVLDPAE
ncbi:MAG: insulinase family protein [Muribaculaceae bacterium]|nr:insulinase family protein [Muribaculaceae bacterium]